MYRKHWYIRLASSIPSDPGVNQYTPGLEIISKRITIDPGVTDDCSAFWKLKFCNLCFHPFIFQRNLLDQNDLLPVSRSMDIRAKSYVAFYSLFAEVDYGFMELVLQADFSAIIQRYVYNYGLNSSQVHSQYCVCSSRPGLFFPKSVSSSCNVPRQGMAPTGPFLALQA